MTFSAATASFLTELKRAGVQPGLQRMQALVDALGSPQRACPVIHLAGTNGKGSVAAMLERALRGAGWRTGLYTSPHLVRFAERIQINRVPLTAPELETLVREVHPVVDALVRAQGDAARPSYFEFMTAVAFLAFARADCDVVVIETGMGGRLDATNVVEPELSVITSIGLDHTEFLGPTFEAIAGEKAGIIKPGRPVVTGVLPPSAAGVIHAAARERHAILSTVVDAFGADPATYPETNLPGAYQRLNAATALLASHQLSARWRLDDAAVRQALLDVDWPARWQTLRVGERTVIVDSTHNEEGARTLDENLRALTAIHRAAPIIAVGVLGATRAAPILAAAARHAAELRLLVPVQRRACSHAELEALLPPSFKGRVIHDSIDALFPSPTGCTVEAPSNVPVVVTGSLYLAGEVLARLQPERGPFEPEWQDF